MNYFNKWRTNYFHEWRYWKSVIKDTLIRNKWEESHNYDKRNYD